MRTSRLLASALALGLFGGAAQAQAPSRGALLARIDSLVTAQMVKNHNVGVSIGIQKGEDLLMARGYGSADLELGVPADAETVYRIGSLTKQFTATGILQLVEQGKIGLQDDITKFLPDYPTQGHKVTIHELLTHTSGVKSYTSLGPAFWNEKSRLDLTDDQMLALFENEPFDFNPGEKWLYDNSGYFLLGVIITKVTGLPYRQYLEEKILAPLGLHATRYCDEQRILPHRAQGYEVVEGQVVNDGLISMNTPGAAGAMCSTVIDLLAWQQASNRAALITPADRDKMRTGYAQASPNMKYGYALGIGQADGHQQIAHSGGINGFSSWLAYYPDDDLTVVVLTNNGGGQAPRFGQMIARAVFGLDPGAK
jgi:CubicO group peptidase (beta-lactamase class C family)